jgi:hypothetical protein
MWAQLVEAAGAFLARLTPNTPPAAWLPWVGYTAAAIGALVIFVAVWKISGSSLAAIAAALAYVARPATDHGDILMFALAILGIFFTPQSRARSLMTMPLTIVAVITGNLMVFLLVLAGFGLAVVGDHIAAARGPKGQRLRTTAMVALTLILITAPLPVASTSTPPPPRPLGHDRVTLNSFRALVSNIPTDSALVVDDSITGILFHAIDKDLRRANVIIARTPNDPAFVRQALKWQRVFALPYAQQTLSLEGFKIIDGLHAADRGLAEVVTGGECITASREWQAASSLIGRQDLALVADVADHRGPVVIYLAGPEPIRIDAVNWPPRTLRGFSPRTFDLSDPKDRQDFEQTRTEDQGPRTQDLSGGSVTRIALWRMPDAALQMPIHLSTPATYAAVKLAPEAKNAVSVCPAFPAAVSAIR